MVAEDLYRIAYVEDASISPDGATIAFVRKHLDAEADEYRAAIWAIGSDGREPSKWTAGSKQDSQPRWSADGRWLAFLSDRGGEKKQIWLLPTGGGEVT